MDRLLLLRRSQANSVLNNNSSISSELGYETAQEDSISSLYYSINENTLTDIDSPPNSPNHPQVATTSDAMPSSQTNQNAESLILAGTETDVSLTETIVPAENERSIKNEPAIFTLNKESVNHDEAIISRHAITTSQNMISNLLTEPSSNMTSSSSVVQKLCVAVVAQQRTKIAPELNRGKNRKSFIYLLVLGMKQLL